ncbi:MAG: hypothetical protein V2J65_07130, partial [Desulfobacteraceae bacterium]|nr:hypothetical protein [Desulfobacteraceae bacterium]
MKPVQKIVAVGVVCILAVSSLAPPAAFGITVKEEEDMSRQMMALIYKYFDIVDDPAVVTYVNNI